MKVQELKSKVEEYREGLKTKAGSVCQFSESGPVGMSVIDALVKCIEAQEKRIQELEKGAKFA